VSEKNNYIIEFYYKIRKHIFLILITSSALAAVVAFYVSTIDVKIDTYSKIFPLSFNKSSSSPIDAIKAQFGISDKTDYSVIYNIKELVNSKTLSTRIANAAPSKKNKHKTIAHWLIDDYNKHCKFYQGKIKIKPNDTNSIKYKGASLLKGCTEVLVEKTEFTKITSTTHDKDLSKEINMAVLAEISDYYIQVATEKPRTDLNKIKVIRDSLKLELGAIESAIAGFQDANQLSVKYSTGIPQAKLLRDRAEIEQLYATTATAYQNARFKLLSESPIFQILDYPGEPFNYTKPSWLKMGVFSFLGFMFLMTVFVCRKLFIKLLKEELIKS
jgi:hypothetical protein